ncbi:MAG: AI-2E family transporter [Patescibacteria group bacterium]|nr:AI-2E family transporter [Patescibacteria group bacterium]
MVNKVEISHKTIFFIIFLLLGVWLIVQIRDILLLLFVAFILMSALSPTVDRLEKLRIPRALAILIIYIIGIFIIGLVGTIIVPPLLTQSGRLIVKLPDFINTIFPSSRFNMDNVIQQIIPVSEGFVKISLGIFSNFITMITFLVFTFYFLLERKRLEKDLIGFVGPAAGERIFSVISQVEVKLGNWVRGELTLMTIIGIASYIGLLILKVDYALPLAIFAGFLEVIPIMGPIISAIPAVLVAFGTSPGLAIVVVALYILIQQLENHLIVPTVMRRAVGLSPLITILALAVGGRLAGVIGALISVPIIVVLQIILKDTLKYQLS